MNPRPCDIPTCCSLAAGSSRWCKGHGQLTPEARGRIFSWCELPLLRRVVTDQIERDDDGLPVRFYPRTRG